MSDVNDESDLQRIWEETQIEYRELAGIKEGGLLEVLTVDDILGRLAEEKANDEKAKITKHGKTKEIIRKTLVCVDSLGKIAAQGASIVSKMSKGAGISLTVM